MAHTKSAKKRIRTSKKRRLHNRAIKSQIKTYIAKAEELILGGKLEVAEEAVRQAVSVLDKAARKGVIHANNAARRKSRLMKKLNAARASLSQQGQISEGK